MKSTMKKINFKAILFLPLIILMLFTACQNEEEEIINPTNEETIIPNSNLASLMLNTATRDGSYDNIIDFANCLSIELPVTIIVNNITITITSVEGLEELEAILEQFDNDSDEIEIQFPIIIILSDYSEIVINNQSELDEFIDECSGENEEDDDIECIDFQYPITIAIYNSDFQVIDTIVINSDEELYMFIENLEGGVLASLNFPVTMVLANGETIEVNNNEELEIAISEAIYDCDEDDDNDWNDDDEVDCSEDYVTLTLSECHWYAGTNLFTIFVAEEVYFLSDGTVEIYNSETNDLTTTGTWNITSDSAGNIFLNLEFDIEPYSLLTLSWEIVECGQDRFQLENGDNSLVFEQDCEIEDNTFDCPDLQANIGDDCVTSTGDAGFVNADCECEVDDTNFDCPDLQANFGDDCVTSTGDAGFVNADCACELRDTCTEQDIDAYLLECVWYIVNYNGDDNLITFEFDFNEDGTVIITSENQVITAMWSTSENGAGVILEFGNVNGGDIQAITGNWFVVECNSGRLEMFRDNDSMVMEQDCN